MEEGNYKEFREIVKLVYRVLIVLFSIVGIFACILFYMMIDPDFSDFRESDTPSDYVAIDEDAAWDKIEDGVHLRTGLIEAEGLMETVNNCTNCHSAKLVTQNRMNKERWGATIDWMQETQNLGDLGDDENIIINYLVTNYPVEKKGRRQALLNIEWYELKD
ncbi:MAG: hypothetical protein ACJARZ_000132 [Dokdonia sp.]|jgi:hypothetical protein